MMENGFCKRADMPAPSRSLELLSVEAIVQRCLNHDRPAWNEFFTRYTPLLKNSIRKSLIRHGTLELSEDIDIIADIYLKLVEKLYTRDILKQCPRTDGLKSWLASVASNQTIDWLKEKGRLKNLPQLQDEAATRSLDEPLDEDGTTLLDTLPCPQQTENVLETESEQLLGRLHALENVKQRWVLRLSILGQADFQEEEYQALATLTGQPIDQIRQSIATLEDAITVREQERTEDYGRTVLYWHELRRLEQRYRSLNLDTSSDHNAETIVLGKQIAEKRAKRDELLKRCKKLPRPSDRDIAELIGIPENQVGSTLRRARESLTEKCAEAGDMS